MNNIEEIKSLLQELSHNTGDARGRDGEYLSDAIEIILNKIESLKD